MSIEDFQTLLNWSPDWIFNPTVKCQLRVSLQQEYDLGIWRHENIGFQCKCVTVAPNRSDCCLLEQVWSQQQCTFPSSPHSEGQTRTAAQPQPPPVRIYALISHILIFFCADIVFQISIAGFSYQACEYLMNKHLQILIRRHPWHASFLYVLGGGGGGGKWWHAQSAIVSVSS